MSETEARLAATRLLQLFHARMLAVDKEVRAALGQQDGGRNNLDGLMTTVREEDLFGGPQLGRMRAGKADELRHGPLAPQQFRLVD